MEFGIMDSLTQEMVCNIPGSEKSFQAMQKRAKTYTNPWYFIKLEGEWNPLNYTEFAYFVKNRKEE